MHLRISTVTLIALALVATPVFSRAQYFVAPVPPMAITIAPVPIVEPLPEPLPEPMAQLVEPAPIVDVFAEPNVMIIQKDSATNDPVYNDGMKAMDDGHWVIAVNSFDKVAAAKGDRAGAALYWKAYSLQKLGRKDESHSTCDQLSSTYPMSTWNRECVTLRVQNSADLQHLSELATHTVEIHRGDIDRAIAEGKASADAARANADAYRAYSYSYSYGGIGKGGQRDPNEEIKLIALNSLMQQEPAKAIPTLRTYILSKDKPIEYRRNALFMLSRSKAPEAQSLLLEVANNKTDVELQRAAVQSIGMRGKQAAPDLLTIYRNSTDKNVKRAALSGLNMAHDATDMVELARNEKDLDMKREIVSQLSIMHDGAATAYMEELLK